MPLEPLPDARAPLRPGPLYPAFQAPGGPWRSPDGPGDRRRERGALGRVAAGLGPSGGLSPGSVTLRETVGQTALAKRQARLAHHVRMVVRGYSNALFVFGAQGGLGKTWTINATLREERITPVLVNSHVTPLGLYGLLYRHRRAPVIFFDDVDSMFKSVPHLGLLRSALWGTPRTVTYVTSVGHDLPERFTFQGKCIFAANVVPAPGKNAAFDAVLTRCDTFTLAACNAEIIDYMRERVGSGDTEGLTRCEAMRVVDFIAEHATKDTQLSLRILGPALGKYRYARSAGVDWRDFVRADLRALGARD